MRINEIDDFYENNIRDSRVLNFQKIKIILKKLLTYDPEIIFKFFLTNHNIIRGVFSVFNGVKNKKIYSMAQNMIKISNKIKKI